MEKYLTSEQVAAILQVHPFTVLKYLKSGTLEGVKIGRVYRVKESDVEKFLNDMSIGNGKKTREKEQKEDPNQSSIEVTEKNGTNVNGIKESILGKTEERKDEVHKIELDDPEQKEKVPYYKIL